MQAQAPMLLVEKAKSTTIAMVGNPNTGKSALFNALTGGNAHVGNWPGVTVEKKEGKFRHGGLTFNVIDLPGTYSLTTHSIDERIARDFILSGNADIVINVVDSTNIERNLYLTVMLLELGIKSVIALNMSDIINREGIRIDTEKMSEMLGGVPIVMVSATKREGINELKDILRDTSSLKHPEFKIPYGDVIETAISKIETAVKKLHIGYDTRFTATKLLEGDIEITETIKNNGGQEVVKVAMREAAQIEESIGYDIETAMVEKRYAFIDKVVRECVKGKSYNTVSLSDRLDNILTNRVAGIPIFAAVMWGAFQLTFSIGGIFADYIDSLFGTLSEIATSWLSSIGVPHLIVSLLTDGIIGGVGTVLVFLPNIIILFLLLAFLEDSGYMARAAFVMDRIMYAVGLPGKSFIPMLIGFGCNVPAVMSARTISSERDRLLTILINPFVSCSARLPIYILFTSIFFPKHQGLVVFSLYALGIIIAVLSAKLFKLIIPSLKGHVSPLVMELPPYRFPTLKSLLAHTWERTSSFIKKAGTIIVAGVTLVWILSNLPAGVKYASEFTYMGKIGSIIAPIMRPAGFGFWQAGVALLFGIVAKETVVGTMGTLLGGEETLSSAIAHLFTPLSAYAFMVMSLLYIPCIATIGTIYRETNSLRWTLFSVLYSILVGWVAAVVIYQTGLLFT